MIEGNAPDRSRTIAGPIVAGPTLDRDKLFPEDAWERKLCKVLYTKQGFVIFQDYLPKDDGSVDVWPITIVVPSAAAMGPAANNVASRQSNLAAEPSPILIRAPRAVLKFDKPVSIGGGFGKLESGQLVGDVEISRQPNGTDPESMEQAFRIETANIQLTPQRVYAFEPVDFFIGNNHGSGRNLMIDLSQDATETVIEKPRMQKIQLQQLDRLVIDNRKPGEPTTSGFESSKIEVTCRGPFEFDVVNEVASLSDEVVVRRLNQSGDRLDCVSLKMMFVRESGPENLENDKKSKLQLRQVVAQGVPAVFRLPSRKTLVQSNKIEHNLITNIVALSGGNLKLIQDQTQIVARSLRYRIRDDGALGETYADGPGYIYKPSVDRTRTVQFNGRQNSSTGQENFSSKEFQVNWSGKMLIRPHEGRKAISFYEEAKIGLGRDTRLDADELHIWIDEIRLGPVANRGNVTSTAMVSNQHVSGKKQKWNWRPTKLVAVGNVQIESPQLSGQTQTLTADWNYVKSSAPSMATIEDASDSQSTGLLQPRFVSGNTTPSNQSKQKLGFSSQSVVVQIDSLTNEQSPLTNQQRAKRQDEIRRLVVEGNVRIDEIVRRTQKTPKHEPLQIQGQKVVVVPQSNNQHRIEIYGDANPIGSTNQIERMGQLSARGMALRGNPIYFDQTADRAWILGPGQILIQQKPNATPVRDVSMSPLTNLPSGSRQQNLLFDAGTKSTKSRNIVVDWTGGMVFHGNQVYFEHGIVVNISSEDTTQQTRNQTITNSQALTLLLNKKIDLTNPDKGSSDEIKLDRMILVGEIIKPVFENPNLGQQVASVANTNSVKSDGRVGIENRSFDSNNQLISRQISDFPSAIYFAQSGDISAQGTGSIGVWQNRASKNSQFRTASSSNTQTSHSGTLTYTQSNSDGRLSGKLTVETLKFSTNVRVAHGQVANFNQTIDPDQLRRPTGKNMVMRCDEMTLDRWMPRGSAEANIELIAVGNARATGEKFSASGSRISFDKQKEMVVMTGNAPSFVRMERQTRRTGKPDVVIAETVKYYFKTGQSEVDGIKHGDFSQGGR